MPHRLYGLLARPSQPSVGAGWRWSRPVLDRCQDGRRPAIVVGGTGLYLHALLRGMPACPTCRRSCAHRLRAWAVGRPAAELHARLAASTPQWPRGCPRRDPQRCCARSRSSRLPGRSLADWQAQRRERPRLPMAIVGVALLPPPALVNPRIEARLDAMLAEGAQMEVTTLLARRPDALQLAIAKVHGLRELAAVQRGELAPMPPVPRSPLKSGIMPSASAHSSAVSFQSSLPRRHSVPTRRSWPGWHGQSWRSLTAGSRGLAPIAGLLYLQPPGGGHLRFGRCRASG